MALNYGTSIYFFKAPIARQKATITVRLIGIKGCNKALIHIKVMNTIKGLS